MPRRRAAALRSGRPPGADRRPSAERVAKAVLRRAAGAEVAGHPGRSPDRPCRGRGRIAAAGRRACAPYRATTSPEAADRVGEILSGDVVVHGDHLAVPHDRARAPVAGVEIGRGQRAPVLVARPIDAEAVDGVADELRRAGLRIERLQRADADIVIVVDAALLRVALAGILGLVGDRIAPGCIERVEQRHAGQEHADRAGGAARPRRKLGFKRQSDLHRLLRGWNSDCGRSGRRRPSGGSGRCRSDRPAGRSR